MSHTKHSILRFSLICDSADIETAQTVIKPLRIAPTLADCRIRLARAPNSSLQELAREVSMQAKRDTPADYPFRLLDLPPEIRLKILEFTDLIAPLREVEWSSERGFALRFSLQICRQIDCPWSGPCVPPRYPACQFTKCWHMDYQNAGCFCHRHHAAFSSTCKCWAPPTSLFLVCKLLQHEAQTIFYSQNRFVIVAPLEECYRAVTSTPERLDISIFWRDIVPPHALSLLKFLDIVFPPFYNDYLGEHEPAYRDWLQAVNYFADLARLPSLTLRVHMADIGLYPEHAPEYRTQMTREESQTIVNAYERAIKPLSKLRERGLNRFFADLTLPRGRTAESIQRYEKNTNSFTAERRGLEKWAERLVMGCEYDSTALPLGEPEESQWHVLAFEHYCT